MHILNLFLNEPPLEGVTANTEILISESQGQAFSLFKLYIHVGDEIEERDWLVGLTGAC